MQAAHILRYKALHPADHTVTEEEAERDQRVDDPYDDSPEDEDGDDEDATSLERKEETHTEVTLLIEDLHLDAASQFSDIIHEVRFSSVYFGSVVQMSKCYRTELTICIKVSMKKERKKLAREAKKTKGLKPE